MIRLRTVDPARAWAAFRPDAQRPWDFRLAAHLLRRAAFCGTPREVAEAVKAGLPQTLDRLFDQSPQAFDSEIDAVGETVAASQQPRRLAAWWLLRMAQSPHPFLENVTLFWHGHFATSAAKVRDSRAMFAQNQTLRRLALGRFEELVQAISCDVAMLVYLDSTDNRKTRPNENYARELLELFCLGLDHYSEQDIKQLARCFTGWEVRQGRFQFNPAQHDRGTKTLFGQAGEWRGEQAVQIVLQQPAAAHFIAEKLVRYFVADDLQLSEELLSPLAKTLRENGFHIGPVIRQILESELFFSEESVGRKIRGPVAMAIGLMRSLGVSTNMDQLSQSLETLGQLPMFPPNVKGWDGGRDWINAATLLGRQRLARQLIDSIASAAPAELARRGWTELAKAPDELVTQMLALWAPISPPPETLTQLSDAGRGRGNQPLQLIRQVASMVCALPEFQLS